MVLQREYFKQGKVDQFRQILEEGSSPGILPLQILVCVLLSFNFNCLNTGSGTDGLVYQAICIFYLV